jgi:hypothetical protein
MGDMTGMDRNVVVESLRCKFGAPLSARAKEVAEKRAAGSSDCQGEAYT